MIDKIFEIAESMKIGISRSEKRNTWTMTTATESGLIEEVFTGDARSFLAFLKKRCEA